MANLSFELTTEPKSCTQLDIRNRNMKVFASCLHVPRGTICELLRAFQKLGLNIG
jgi:hypothetical protein